MILVVCPLHEVDAAIGLWKPSHMIGMASPEAETAGTKAGIEQLQLSFHDIAEPRPGLQAASPVDVKRLLDFAQAWPGEAPLLIQCWAGVSRSPAAAYVLACMMSDVGSEDRLAWRLREAAPFATPNLRVVELADQALGRQGAMVGAIASIGRGAETSMGSTFVLALS